MGAEQSSANGGDSAGPRRWESVNLPRYTLDDLSKHDKADDAWIAVDGGVYDVSRFVYDHPGGAQILLSVAGKECTHEYEDAQHSAEARKQMEDYLVGVVADASAAAASSHKIEPAASEQTTTTKANAAACSATEVASSSSACGSGGCASCSAPAPTAVKAVDKKSRVLVLYASQTGTSQKIADDVGKRVQQLLDQKQQDSVVSVAVKDVKLCDPEDLPQESYVIFVASTYENGTPPLGCGFYWDWLAEAVSDFRVGNEFLVGVRYCVVGVGNSIYDERYNTAAKQLDSHLHRLGGARVLALSAVDSSVSRSDGKTDDDDVAAFLKSLSTALTAAWTGREVQPVLQAVDSGDEVTDEDSDEDTAAADEPHSPLADVEDLGGSNAKKVKQPKIKGKRKKGKNRGQNKRRPESQQNAVEDAVEDEEEDEEEDEDDDGEVKGDGKRSDMLNPKTRAALTKQGYKLIGSHSGVKLCRWTKAMLRGRGGCYKHTFYGIKSYQCMEMTPSLACANKCTFCWRHHTNPVGKEWKWNMDEAVMILNESIDKHRAMIKQMKGVPGVKPERLKEAFNIRHCALSLVGEPIMYPQINEYVRHLHGRGISSFLVTNAQFPDKIEEMEPVTQLYVSVDAATPESLKAVDRPIFKDFWERYTSSLAFIRDKEQRTVYRMTLVKGQNMSDDHLADYAKLILMGLPTFIEIKGVTFCGNNNSSNITMKSVPFHEEVRGYCQRLTALLAPRYELACEHVHSCCILISDKKMKVDGKWHTWIDYDKFLELQKQWHATGGKAKFTALDYYEETPEWAVFGAAEQGFDPEETRFHKPRKTTQKKAGDGDADADAAAEEAVDGNDDDAVDE